MVTTSSQDSTGDDHLTSVVTVPIDLRADFKFYVYYYYTVTHNGEARRNSLAAARDILFRHLRQYQVDPNLYFFQGSEIYACRTIPNITSYPHIIPGVDQTELHIIQQVEYVAPEVISGMVDEPGESVFHSSSGKTFATDEEHIKHCEDTGDSPTIIALHPAKSSNSRLIHYATLVLSRKMQEGYRKWDDVFMAHSKFDHNSLSVYQAYDFKFDIRKKSDGSGMAYLALTLDIKAKIVRKESFLVTLNKQRGIHEARDYTREWTPQEIAAARMHVGSVVLCSRNWMTYTCLDLDFDHTWDNLMIPYSMKSHTQYFGDKGMTLFHRECRPIVVLKGRRGYQHSALYLPAEWVSLNKISLEDLDQLPQVDMTVRNRAMAHLILYLTRRDRDNVLAAAGLGLGDVPVLADIDKAR